MTRHDEPLQELIQADLDGELSAAERAELARLLLRDPEARRLHEDFRQTDQLLRDIASAEPPPGLREAILAGPASTAGRDRSARLQDRWPAYRAAAIFLGGLLIVGLGLLARDGNEPAENLQGSLAGAQDSLSLRGEGIEVDASLRRSGDTLRLELDLSTTTACEVVARFDPSTTTFVGKTGEVPVTAASDQVSVVPAIGHQAVVLEFSGAAPVRLELRSGGRLLGEGRLSISDH